jgi:hypothetical protein
MNKKFLGKFVRKEKTKERRYKKEDKKMDLLKNQSLEHVGSSLCF